MTTTITEQCLPSGKSISVYRPIVQIVVFVIVRITIIEIAVTVIVILVHFLVMLIDFFLKNIRND